MISRSAILAIAVSFLPISVWANERPSPRIGLPPDLEPRSQVVRDIITDEMRGEAVRRLERMTGLRVPQVSSHHPGTTSENAVYAQETAGGDMVFRRYGNLLPNAELFYLHQTRNEGAITYRRMAPSVGQTGVIYVENGRIVLKGIREFLEQSSN